MLRIGMEGGKFPDKKITKVYFQCYWRYEGVGRCKISRKKGYVTLEWPSGWFTVTCKRHVTDILVMQEHNSHQFHSNFS